MLTLIFKVVSSLLSECIAACRSFPARPRNREIATLIPGLFLALWPATAAVPTIGLPITRHYSIEEIGVSRGPHLSFDRLGRLAVIGGGSYIVLNDDAWIELLAQDPDSPIFLGVLNAPDGVSYYGALASWGTADTTAQGKIEANPLRPEDYPSWVNATNFNHVMAIKSGVMFSGTNGVVLLDTKTGRQTFHPFPEIAAPFTVGNDVFISSNVLGTLKFDPATGETEIVDASIAVHLTARLRDGRIIGATTNGSLVFFDGKRFVPSGIRFQSGRSADFSALEALPDGGFAVAVDGDGLFLFTDQSECRMALTTTGYRRIYDLATHEVGVLWVAMESSIEKLLYNDPVSVIDQRSDVVISWPQVFPWKDQTVVASSGRLYDVIPSADGRHEIFTEVKDVPESGAWAVSANAKHLIIGNSDGVFARSEAGFKTIPGLPGASRLLLAEEDLCLVVGSNEIAAMRHVDGEWRECADRLPGFGFPSIAIAAGNALWVELGLNRAGRIWYADGVLHRRLYEDYPWEKPVWINIGVLKQHVVLSGADNHRIFVDKTTGDIVSAPHIEAALAHFPVTTLRIVEDKHGIIWGTHLNGVMTLNPVGETYRLDDQSLASIRDLYPVITLINQQHAWISTESALYHVDQHFEPHPKPTSQPFLVSIKDGKTGEELFSALKASPQISSLPYRRNHLDFRYFSGGYTGKGDPVYAFTMQNGSNTWTVPSADSLLTLPQLEEGNYRLTARLQDGDTPLGDAVVTSFIIRPPWYRSTLAYTGYWTVGLLLGATAAAWAVGRAKRKQVFLEQLVKERTDELRTTMDKLTDEARISATLAERNRLAGEIHDSLQQGLSGLALHLESTLKNNQLDPDIRTRLSVARRMVSYTRQEVQQAVWDLESPLLQNDNLQDALRSLVDLIGTDSTQVEVSATGTETHLTSTIKHHLLRIAQEAITNAVRHSEAEHVRVQLEFTADTAFLAVVDDGKGFIPDEVLTGGIGHFGLRGLRSRAQKINGDLQIKSERHHGTTVSITVALNPTAGSTRNPS